MSKAYTNEEKQQFIHEACEKYAQGIALMNDAKNLLKRCGVELISDADRSAYEDDAEQSIHVYSGIKKLAMILGQQPRHPRTVWRDGTVNENELGVVTDGFLFFQLGDARSPATKYYYR